MSDDSTRSLISQLSDLLYGLTDGHEGLLRKVRGVREEMEGADRSVSSRSTTFVHQTPFIESHGSANSRFHALVDKMSDEAHDADQSFFIGEIELPRRSIHIAPHETPAPSHAAVVTLSPDMDLVVPPGDTTPSTQATGEDGPPHEGLEKRNYNFFDELDARLTDLIGPEPGSASGLS